MTQAGESGTGAARPSGDAGGASDLDRRIERLRACVEEVADLVDAGLERLETLEMQLGEPGSGVEAAIADGMERCERLLDGIDHRLYVSRQPVPPDRLEPGLPPRVLVVMVDSRRRTHWCLALERQGMHAVAATDERIVQRRLAEEAPAVVLLDDTSEEGGRMVDWWMRQDAGTLPPAAALVAAGRREDCALPRIDERHGPASAAAILRRLAGGEGATPHSRCATEESTEHANT